jgi:hypothetical protein
VSDIEVVVDDAWLAPKSLNGGWPEYAPPLVFLVLDLNGKEVWRTHDARVALTIDVEDMHVLRATLHLVAGDPGNPLPRPEVSFALQLP